MAVIEKQKEWSLLESVVFAILTPLDTRSKPKLGPTETVQTETFCFNFVR